MFNALFSAFLPESPTERDAPRYQLVVLITLAACGGILLDYFADIHYRVYAGAAVFFLLGWLGIDRLVKSSSASVPPADHWRWKWIPLAETLGSMFILLGVSALAALWHHGRWNGFGEHEIGLYAIDTPTPVCIEGTAVSEPRWIAPSDSEDGLDYRAGTTRTRLAFSAERIRDGEQWLLVSGCVDLIIEGPTFEFQSGDQLRVYGRLIEIASPTNPGEFDFKRYFRSQSKRAILHTQDAASVVKLASASRIRPLSWLRSQLNEVAWRYMSPDEAGFASAILLGNREQLSFTRKNSFVRTGTAHILSISGLHVGILAGTFYCLIRLGLLSRRKTLLLTTGFVIFYCWLVEFEPPVSRSTIIVVVYCMGRLFGKSGFNYSTLALAALVVLVINPHDLFNLGAQLSFLAVATLHFAREWIFLQPPHDPLSRLIANTRSLPARAWFGLGRIIRTAFLGSCAISFTTFPLVAYHFNVVSPIGVLVNPILLIPVSVAMYSGLVMMVCGMVFPPLASVAGWLCQTSLYLTEATVTCFESFPGAYFYTCGPPATAQILFYVGLFFVAVFPLTRQRLKPILVLSVVWWMGAWWLPDRCQQWQHIHRNEMTCTVIDVGHGSSVLLHMPDGKWILYDAGSFSSAAMGSRNVSAVLWNSRVRHLDTVIVSHADIDHYNALPEIANRFSIGEVVVTRQTRFHTSPVVQGFLKQLSQKSIPVRTVCADEFDSRWAASNQHSNDPESRINFLHPQMKILSPPQEGTGGNDNSNSLVILVEHRGYRVLLTGDVEQIGLSKLLAQPPMKCDLVMAPHHGSFSSDPSEFVKWCDPEVVVISGATQRIKQQSTDIYEQNNRAVYRTDRHGAIRLTVSAEEQRIETWDRNQWKVGHSEIHHERQ